MNSANVDRIKDAIPTGAAEKIVELASMSDEACKKVLERVPLSESEGGFSNEQLQQLEVALYAAGQVLAEEKDPETIINRLIVISPTIFWGITLAPTTVLGPGGAFLGYIANLLYLGVESLNYKWAQRKQTAREIVRELREAIKTERVNRGAVAGPQ